MTGACRLNNKSMRNIRREAAYQCLAIDLAMLGVISKEECEMLIGCGIPKGLILPDGSAGKLISEEALPVKPDFIQTEPEQEPEAEGTEEQVILPEPIPGVTEMPGDETEEDGEETPEVTDDEGRTESDN